MQYHYGQTKGSYIHMLVKATKCTVYQSVTCKCAVYQSVTCKCAVYQS